MKRKLISNLSFNLLIRIISYIFSFLTLLYVTRILQPEVYGLTSFAGSVASYYAMLAAQGMPIYAMRCCAGVRDDRVALSRTFSELFEIGILLALVSAGLFVLTIALVPKLSSNRWLLLIYGSEIFFQLFGFEWLFRGLEKFRFLALSGFASKFISLLFIVLFVHSPSHVYRYAICSMLAGFCSALIALSMLHRYVDLSFSPRIESKHFKPLLVFFLMSCAVTVYNSMDLTMLGFMRPDYETGLYSLAAKGKGILALTGGIVWTSFLPTVTKLWKEGEKKKFATLAGKTYVATIAIQSVVAFICFVFAKQIILLAGGESYLGAVLSFRILLISLIPIGASNIIGGQVLIPAGRESRLLTAEVAGAVFNFVANLILIPRLSIVGAALTTVGAEVIVWVLCMVFAYRDLGIDFCCDVIKRTARKLKGWITVAYVRLADRLWKDRLPLLCPCCRTHMRRFVKFGYKQSPEHFNPVRYVNTELDVICPICRSLPRHRILVSFLEEQKHWLKDKQLLHIAQEKSVRLWLDRNEISVVTADLYEPADLKLNIEDTGLADGSYDAILCNHVLEHVSDYGKALREIYRILRPGGWAVVSFPVDHSLDTVYEDASITAPEGRLEHFGQSDHLRIFGNDTEKMLASYGFEVRKIEGESFGDRIRPVVGPADYDDNVLWWLLKG